MTARIGYLSALTGSDGHLVSGDRSSADGGDSTLRPPRRPFGIPDSPVPGPGFLDDPDLAFGIEAPDEPTVQPGANWLGADGTGAGFASSPADRPVGPAVPEPAGQPERAPRSAPRPARAAPEQLPSDAIPGLVAGGRASQPSPGQAAGAPSLAQERAARTDAADPGRVPVPSRTDTLPSEAEQVHRDADEGLAGHPVTPAPARAANADLEDAGRASLGQPPTPDPMTVDISPHPGVEKYPLSPQEPPRRGRTLRAPGEPWRIPRRGHPRGARSGTGTSGAPQHGAALVSAAEPAGVPSSGTAFTEAREAAQPQVPSPGQPGAAANPPPPVPSGPPLVFPGPPSVSPGPPSVPSGPQLVPPGPPLVGASRVSVSTAGPPLADALPRDAPADAAAEMPAPSDASPKVAAVTAEAPAALQSSASFPAVRRGTASPPAQPADQPPAPSHTETKELTPRLPAADRAQAGLAPAGRPAARPSGSQAEASGRPPEPSLSIGTIEVTLLPPPQALAPARPTRQEPPQRLSRGLGRRFGQGQA